jgi:GNAT superfamily N-acetyltransferase
METTAGGAPPPPLDLVCGAPSAADFAQLVDNSLAMAADSEGVALDRAVVEASVRRLLAEPALGRYFVARAALAAGDSDGDTACANGVTEEGAIVAQLFVTYEFSDWRCAAAWWVQSAYVAPGHRRRGVFTKLYAHVRAAAAAAGAAGVRLYADAGNVRARAAYAALGMSSHYAVYEDLF